MKTLSISGSLVLAESGGHQKIQKFVGEEGSHHLTAFGFESIFVGTETVTFEELIEVT